MAKKSSVTAALLIAIVPAVAIYWLTQGLPDWLSKKTPVDPAISQSVDGRVIDASAQRLLAGAAVLLELGGVTSTDTTDSLGRYLFVAKTVPPVAAILTVRAEGYQPYSLNIALQAAELTQDIPLQPQPPPPPPAATHEKTEPRVPLRFPMERKLPQSTPAAPASLPTVRMTSLALSTPYAKRQLSTAVKVAPSKVTK